MSLDYPENWSEGTEHEYPVLQNENGTILFYVSHTKSPLTANEMLTNFNINFDEVNKRLGNFIHDGYKMTDYGKASVGGKDAIYVDLIMKGDGDDPDYKALHLSIDHKNFTYGFYILPDGDYELFVNEATEILKNVVFP